MSLTLLEKKWKYLENKEKLLRNAFDTNKGKFVGFSVPIVVKDRLQSLITQGQPHDRKEETIRWTQKGVEDYMEMLEYPDQVRVKEKRKASKKEEKVVTEKGDDAEFMGGIVTYLENDEQKREKDKAKFELIAQATKRQKYGLEKNYEEPIVDVDTFPPSSPNGPHTITITNEDLTAIVRHLKSKTDTMESNKVAQYITRSDSVEPSPTFKIPDPFAKYALQNFVYSTKLVRNAILLHNEYLRDDFYCLQFQLPTKYDPANSYSLKMTDITSKDNKDILFSQLPVDTDGFLVFDSLTQKVFNPRKRLPWITQLDDLVGNTFKFEILENMSTKLLVKYVYLDYFSYENYIISLLEIANFQRKEKQRKDRQEYEKERVDVEKLGEEITDAFRAMGEIPEFKIGFGSLIQRQTGAFRHILLRMQAIKENNLGFLMPKTKLLIQ